MKMRLVVVLSMMIPGFFVAREAFGADATLTGDAYISSGRSTGNFGAQTNLYVGNGNTSFLQFDLSTLPAGATSGQIARATLRLNVNRVNTAGPLNVLPVTSAWSESSITFATAPTSSTSVATFEASQPGSYVTVDATTLVQGWVAAPATNFGVALASNSADVVLDSKENDQTGHAAELEITLAGPQGAMGLQGPAGAAGAAGPQGTAGPAGPQGPGGLTGPQGIVGLTGAAGPAGPQGAAGPPVSFKGAWGSGATYVVGDTVAENGTSYIALLANNNVDPATDVTNSGGHWAVLANKGTAGATGPAGAQGLMGLQGPQGNAGPQGVAGAQGPAGPDGPAGTPGAVGSQGPAGPPGAQGIPGPNGPQGAAGTAGAQGPPISFRGTWVSEVPYAVGDAVAENGTSYIALIANSDTDPATDVMNSIGNWAVLASKGDAGAAGADGAAGPQGMMGVQGVQGLPGPQGNAGADGAPGAQGIPGPNGPQGA
ncbi:MAG: DNRLRE domain-containing protein, partial [Terriglobales bacterium]